MPDAPEPGACARGIEAPALAAAVPRKLCTDCGLSRTRDPGRCGTACQFIRPDYAASEAAVHGRARDPLRADEAFFGPYLRMVQARLEPACAGAQWTGIATRLGEKLLEEGAVDAVLAVASDPHDRWKPRPVIVTDPAAMAECRGMKMGYAPLLALLEPAVAAGHRRLAVIGIPCQVHALRAIEAELGLERLYVVGTPCSDNTTTENFHHFLSLLDPEPERVTYLEFRADFYVELRYDDGRKREIPFLQLPISQLPADFFPLTCRTCVDYTNALADLTVGYMAGRGEQWLVVRNARGEELVDRLGLELRVKEPTTAGKRASAVKGFLVNLERAAGGLPTRAMPNWLRPLVGRLMPVLGPKGLEFARARIEMKALEAVVHLRREAPRKLKHMVPAHLWRLTAPYGVVPDRSETRDG